MTPSAAQEKKSSSKSRLRTSSAGRKPKDELDRFIPKLWYWTIRSLCDWSDSALNIEFIPDSEGNRRNRENRTRTFEGIRKRGIQPSSITAGHPRRHFDLVQKVDAHPLFRGTAKVMHSPFWVLLRTTPGDLSASKKLVDQCLSMLGLERLSAWDATELLFDPKIIASLESPTGIDTEYVGTLETLLQRATSHLPLDLDLLCLFGAMYREACLGFKPREAECLGGYFLFLLKRFCNQKFPKEIGRWLEDVARHRVICGDQNYFPPKEKVDWRANFWAKETLLIRRKATVTCAQTSVVEGE